jgi:hypothetical protein
VLLIALGAWCATAPQSARAAGEGTLSGVASYATGPAAGVEVYVSPDPPLSGSSFPTRGGITNASGDWSAGMLPAGSYNLTFVAPQEDNTDNYTVGSQDDVVVAVGATTTIVTALIGPLPDATAPLSLPGLPCLAGSLTVSSSAVEVRVGGGSSVLPWLQASCGGVPDPNPTVQLTIVPGTTDATINDGFLATSSILLEGETGGVVVPPIIDSELTDGTFSVQATWNGLTASISGEVVGRLAGILPPQNPSPALPVASPECSGTSDQSQRCLSSSTALIDTGRQLENLGPLLLPTNWTGLSVPEQLFVLTNLERTARGLPVITGLASDWDTAAQQGAEQGADPDFAPSPIPAYISSPAPGGYFSSGSGYSSVEDPGQPNSIAAMYAWIYSDGIDADGNSGDADCSRSSGTCWGHRDAILNDSSDLSCQLTCAMGAGFDPTGYNGRLPSYTEVFGAGNNSDPLIFTWADEVPSLPICEQAGDSCPWSGATAAASAATKSGSSPKPSVSVIPVGSHGLEFLVSSPYKATMRVGVKLPNGKRVVRRAIAVPKGSSRYKLSLPKPRHRSHVTLAITITLTHTHTATVIHHRLHDVLG